MAFKGYSKPWFSQLWYAKELWDIKGKNALSPQEIEDLVQAMFRSEANVTSSPNWSRLPIDRQTELAVAIKERNRHSAT